MSLSLSSSLPSFTSRLSYSFFHSGALPDPLLPNHAYLSPPSPALPPRLRLDLRLQYLEALQSIWAVYDWVASRDSFL